jgi:hypothetical protein
LNWNEYTVELEARAKDRPPDVEGDTLETNASVLLTLLEGDGTFLGPVLSASADGRIKVLGQIATESADTALALGRATYGKLFGQVFGEYDWTLMAAAPFSPDQTVESIQTA